MTLIMRRWWVVLVFLAACRSCGETHTSSPPPASSSTTSSSGKWSGGGCDVHFTPGWSNPPFVGPPDLAVRVDDMAPPPSPCVHDHKCHTIGDTCEVDTDADVIQCICVQWTFGGLWDCASPDGGSQFSVDAGGSD